jgi:hypothetical protein
MNGMLVAEGRRVVGPRVTLHVLPGEYDTLRGPPSAALTTAPS